MNAITFAPSRFVEEVSLIDRVGGRARRVDRLPDGRTAIVFRVADRGHRGDVTILGPRTRALLKHAGSFETAVMLQFRPGWATLPLGVPVRELTDAFVALDDVWGSAGRNLLGELLEATSIADMLEGFARAFERRAQHTRELASAPLARRAARLIAGGEMQVERVADRLGVTPRHLRRAFGENIGVAPKQFARSVRLQRAVQLARTSSDWGRIAVAAGYYDQAHLIADFRDLVGMTPRAFRKRVQSADA